ncbi:MAG: DUF11 domain-containing protein [Anaerolineae bacterium]|nr:DUF11 domain-containing protein [Anaerolineae bacterium]
MYTVEIVASGRRFGFGQFLRERRWIYPLCLAFLIAGFTFLALWHGVSDLNAASPPPPAIHEWRSECIDCPKYFGTLNSRSLRLDSTGKPHVVYGGDHLYYAWYDGSDWHKEIVDDALGVGAYATLALDTHDAPNIAYYDRSQGILKFARHVNDGWEIQNVISESASIWSLALALDAFDVPRVAYHQNMEIRYGQLTEGGWHTQKVAGVDWDARYVFSDVALDFDLAGTPYISYMDGSFGDGDLMLARLDNTLWLTQVVDSVGIYMGYTSLDFDSDNRIHIGYSTSGYQNTVRHAYEENGTWHYEIVQEDVGCCNKGPVSLSVDGDDGVHIGYYSDDEMRIVYAHRVSDKNWVTETVTVGIRDISGISLALDNSAQPYICYLSTDNEMRLACTHQSNNQWQTQTVDTGAWVGHNASLAIDSKLMPHVAYRDVSNNDLKYAQRVNNVWITQTVDSDTYVDSVLPLVLDDAGFPHIVYHDFENYLIKYTHFDGAEWEIQDVISPNIPLALTIDSKAVPHIAYLGDHEMNYAFLDAGVWVTQTIVDNALIGLASMACDSSDVIHISYSHLTSGAVEYARLQEGSWQTQTVMSSNGSLFDMALDSTGNPHILVRATGGPFYHMRWDGLEWESVIVPDCEARPALALDSNDTPHYLCSAQNEAQYMRWENGIWYTQTLAGWGHVYVGTSLGFWNFDMVMDIYDNPQIVYEDDRTQDLHYQVGLPAFDVQKHASPQHGLKNADTLAYTITLSGPGSQASLNDPLPRNVRYVSGTLTSPAAYSPTIHAVVWEGVLPTTTLSLSFQVKPVFTGTGSMLLAAPIVNTVWATDTTYNRTDMAQIIVNGIEVYLPVVMRSH